MIKYTASYCKSHDIVVVCNTYEEYQQIKKINSWSGTNLDEKIFNQNTPCYFYTNNHDNGWDSCSSRCFNDHGGNCTALEFLRDNQMEKWCIKITEENCKALNDYLYHHRTEYKDWQKDWKVKLDPIKDYYFHSIQPSSGVHTSYSPYKDFTEITYEDFLNLNDFGITSDCPKELTTILKKLKIK